MIHRRAWLKGLVSLPFLAWIPGLRAAAFSPSMTAASRPRPGDSTWPSPARWQTLNERVGGNLSKVEPLIGPTVAQADLENPFYIGDQAGGSACSGLYQAWVPSPSAYVIKAQRAADVAAALNFARDEHLRLVVKGGGHSYKGTSNAPDALLVWTRAMNRVTIHDAFVPQGGAGRIAPVPAVSAEAGAMWIDLYDAVTTRHGRYVQGGGCSDVGVAGLIQSGGFGSFSKGFGTAAANLLEAEIVTADGAVRVVNAVSEPDLFWALQGGGGGSWGVITRVTLKTHDLPSHFGAVVGVIQASSDASFRQLIRQFADFYPERLFNSHWGEVVTFTPENRLVLAMTAQGLSQEQMQTAWQPFFDWIARSPHEYSLHRPLRLYAKPARQWWDPAHNSELVVDPRPNAPRHHAWWQGNQIEVGAYFYGYDSVWLPASLLEPAQRDHLAEALFAASRPIEFDLHFNKGLAGGSPAAVAATRATATNPDVCRAFALAMVAELGPPAYPGQTPGPDLALAARIARDIELTAAQLRQLSGGLGAYVSESSYFTQHWAQDFWGKNYPRLLKVKAQYDPTGLFFVRHGVGSEGWSPDGFTPTGRI